MTQSWGELYLQLKDSTKTLNGSLEFMDAFCECCGIQPEHKENENLFSTKFSEFYNQLKEHTGIIENIYMEESEMSDLSQATCLEVQKWIDSFVDFAYDLTINHENMPLNKLNYNHLIKKFYDFRKDINIWILVKRDSLKFTKEYQQRKPIQTLVYNLLFFLPTKVLQKIFSHLNQKKEEQTA